MGHRHDFWERLRNRIIPSLGLAVQLLEDINGDDYYVTGETHNTQFVGRVPLSEEEFEKELDDMDFKRNPLASLKSLSSGETEEGSWRKVEPDSDMQLHVVLYDGSDIQNADTGYTYVYAHYELRWDTDPIGHYKGRNFEPEEGVRRMKDLLDQNGITYDLIRP